MKHIPGRLRNGFTDDSLRVAVLVGFFSIPFSIILSIQNASDGTLAGIPILVAGIITGIIYERRPTETRRAGIQTSLIASVGIVTYQIIYVVSVARSLSFTGSGILLLATPLMILIGIGLSVLIGVVGSFVGSWMSMRLRFSG